VVITGASAAYVSGMGFLASGADIYEQPSEKRLISIKQEGLPIACAMRASA
jgi:hypothetical protein